MFQAFGADNIGMVAKNQREKKPADESNGFCEKPYIKKQKRKMENGIVVSLDFSRKNKFQYNVGSGRAGAVSCELGLKETTEPTLLPPLCIIRLC